MATPALRCLAIAVLVLGSCHDRDRAPPSGLPAAPSNLTGRKLSTTTLRLAWTDNATNETGFAVERRIKPQPFERIAVVPANTTQHDDSGLNPDAVYTYRIVAINDIGASPPSNEASFTTGNSAGGCCPSGCAIVVGHVPAPAAESAGSGSAHLWMWTLRGGREVVVADAPFPAPEQVAVLDGGDAGTAWVGCAPLDGGAVQVYEMTFRFSTMGARADGRQAEFCFMLHDMRRGDYTTSGLHAAARTTTRARLPLDVAVDIEPLRPYHLTVAVDRARKVFALRFAGFWIARDVPLDGVVAGTVRYAHPDR